MLRSMTGFGRTEGTVGQKKFTAEVRSLNSKQLDLNVRMPNIYRERELELRSWLSENIQRGKCDVIIFYESIEPEKRTGINKDLMVSYYADLKEVADRTSMADPDYLAALIRIPDVMRPEIQEFDEKEWTFVFGLVRESFARFDQYRKNEGARQQDDFLIRIQLILKFRDALNVPMEQRTQRMRDRLRNNLQDVIESDKIDQNRFEQEVIYYLERFDISEEFQRLHANCDHFLEELKLEGSGKKLGFISQEIGREINTIGSKANDSDMQRLVVQMKDELEKIKEQINNVL